jgi:DHA2 family multidrug resistance protein
MQQYFLAHGSADPAAAMHSAIIAAGNAIRAQATIMGYSDSFGLLGLILLVAAMSVALLRKGAASGGAAH